ncbi:iron (metal) dependent repressor, DtxR family [Pustulibacterium marinum]|uniref:Transcriptional regulator MntR n=1 Tax=Pustulibacterium marinum TaxID=1224947 RepID=A0A1I7I6F9_9FLAO|nr:metal-dependent transcriptional regulator [Pustulibacterium marinum]SFU68525.1 iron (metal) dependent repressor, DtxR family [Pustulibacterium marinum]
MTLSEENYLKAIYHLSDTEGKGVSTNKLAEAMETKASSATDMIKKLADKSFVNYKKYQGVKLTKEGRLIAASVVRKHRLWEVFLVEKLNFNWDEVHEVAEQLEHVKSEKLIEELDAYLDFPTVDPHGDPIPDKYGEIQADKKVLLSSLKPGEKGICVGLEDTSKEFLQYLDKIKISLGIELKVLEKEPFDNSVVLQFNDQQLTVSAFTTTNIYVRKS